MRSPARQRGEGFTLLESLLAAVVLAMVVAAITLPFTAGARSQQAEARQTLGTSLAEELMEEILQKPFEEPDDADQVAEDESAFGPDAGESSRADFDAIDDYHGYTEAAGSVQGADGSAVTDPAAAGLSRHASVAYVYVSGQNPADDPSFMRVVVEVRYQNQPIVTLTRLVHWIK